MKTFAALATIGLVAVGVAAATVLHIWFKYDSPSNHEREDNDRD